MMRRRALVLWKGWPRYLGAMVLMRALDRPPSRAGSAVLFCASGDARYPRRSRRAAPGTHSGWDDPGVTAHWAHGRVGSATYSTASKRFALFTALKRAEDDGWRDHSRSTRGRGYVNGSWADHGNAVDLTRSAAQNRLIGNGAVPLDVMRDEGRSALVVHPDQTEPDLMFVQVSGSRQRVGEPRVRAAASLRHNRIDALHGGGTEYAACEDPNSSGPGGQPFLCRAEDDEASGVVNAFGAPAPAPPPTATATRNTSRTDQDRHGASLRAEAAMRRPGRPSPWHAGISYDAALLQFDSQCKLARLTSSRGAEGSGLRNTRADVLVDARTRTTARRPAG